MKFVWVLLNPHSLPEFGLSLHEYYFISVCYLSIGVFLVEAQPHVDVRGQHVGLATLVVLNHCLLDRVNACSGR